MPAYVAPESGVLRFGQKGAMPSATGMRFESEVVKATHSSMSSSSSPGTPIIR